MPQYFYFSPKLRENALWASMVEFYLLKTYPGLTPNERRRLPMMQGVYKHLQSWEKSGKKLDVPETPEGKAALSEVDRSALLSQYTLAMGTLGLTIGTSEDNSMYESFISAVQSTDEFFGVRQFSTSDIAGFGLCLVMWAICWAREITGKWAQWFIQTITQLVIREFGLAQDQIERMNALAEDIKNQVGDTMQYQDPQKNYGAITIPNNARLIMLGDWGTSLDDAQELLHHIWTAVYNSDTNRRPIVFVHLGDIYYSGLVVECEQNFKGVFDAVRTQMTTEIGPDFVNSGLADARIYTIPGNHEYYSYGYGYYKMLGELNTQLNTGQTGSTFCLRTANNKWQFLGMDTGQADHNAIEPILQSLHTVLLAIIDAEIFITVPFPLDLFVIYWVNGIVNRLVGPHEPTLPPGQVSWLKSRLNEMSGKGYTVMLSHHQLYSNAQQIDTEDPEYLNKFLYKTFHKGTDYFASSISAWFWGHEHTFAVYKNGTFELAKGRLLGSSSYETKESKDHPYNVKYPQVQYAGSFQKAGMSPNYSSSQDPNDIGFYEHACAVIDLAPPAGGNPSVTYYEFPAWGLDASPQLSQQLLVPLSQDGETLGKPVPGTISKNWYGDVPLDYGGSNSLLQTGQSPAIARVGDTIYMVYTYNSSLASMVTEQNKLYWAKCVLTKPADPTNPNLTALPGVWTSLGPVTFTDGTMPYTSKGPSLSFYNLQTPAEVSQVSQTLHGDLPKGDPSNLPNEVNQAVSALDSFAGQHPGYLVVAYTSTDSIGAVNGQTKDQNHYIKLATLDLSQVSAHPDGQGITWTNLRGGPVQQLLESNLTPAIASWEDGVHVVWVNANSSYAGQLWEAVYGWDYFTGFGSQSLQLPFYGVIQDANNHKKTTTGQPSLTSNGASLLLSYLDSGNKVGWAMRSLIANPPPPGTAPSNYHVQTGPWTWQGDADLQAQDASIRADQDFLYMMYRGEGTAAIWQSAFQGLEGLAKGTKGDWIVNSAVARQDNQHPQCSNAPVFVMAQEQAAIVYRGTGTYLMFWAWV